MTTRATLINYIDRELKDTPKKHTTTATGDAATTVFDLCSPFVPIVPASEAITVADDSPELQVRDTDYTIDNETGQVTFTAAPAAKTITCTFQYCYFSPQRKIDELNHCLTAELFEFQTDDYSLVTNGINLSTFESGETWNGGNADTTHKKTGRQGIRIESTGSEVNAVRSSLTLDMKGEDSDKIQFFAFTDEADLISDATIKFHETRDAKLFSYEFSSELRDGWTKISIDRSEFTNTGSADWQAIVEIEFELTASASTHLTVDNLSLIYSDYKYRYSLPSWVRKLITVQIYDADANSKQLIREWEISNASGTGGVDELILLKPITGGAVIELYGYGNFDTLAAAATVTDLPARAERLPALWVAHAVMRTEEIARDRFDKLPVTAKEQSVNPAVNLKTSLEFKKLFEDERKRLKLAPIYSGFTTIKNQ